MAKPFIKIVGGKRDHAVLDLLSTRIGRATSYIEPFLGGGAPFFILEERGLFKNVSVILGDADAELIGLYEAIRRHPQAVHKRAIEEVVPLIGAPKPVQERAFLDTRKLWNLGERNPGYQLFLRHAVFNGLFRRNRLGELNTPPRDRLEHVRIPSADDLVACAQALHEVSLLDWDFRQYDEELFIGPDTLVLCDPPYFGGFTNYIGAGFNEADQIELIETCASWSANGADVIYCNSAAPFVLDALRTYWPEAKIVPVLAKRAVAADGNKRQPAPEVIAYVD